MNYLKNKLMKSNIIHQFILFLLRVSKSKYELIEPSKEYINIVTINKQVEIVKESFILNEYEFLKEQMLPSQAREFIEKKAIKKLIENLKINNFIKHSVTSTSDPLRKIITAEIQVIKP